MSSVPTLAYWDIRGLAQPIRLLLKYSGIQFNDKRYKSGEGSEFEANRKIWFNEKPTLGLDFPNLPYYIDADIKLTHSLAILRYLGRKHGLEATDAISAAKQDSVEQQLQDLKMGWFQKLFQDFNEESKAKLITEVLIPQLQLLSTFLGKNEWFAGRLTYVDFIAYETFDWIRHFSPETINKFNNLKQYLNRFESLPKIKAYMSSKEFIDWPLFSSMAKWGYKK